MPKARATTPALLRVVGGTASRTTGKPAGFSTIPTDDLRAIRATLELTMAGLTIMQERVDLLLAREGKASA